MITYDEILNMNFHKKSPCYTGWHGGMRFMLKKEVLEDETTQFRVWAWPGPYIFELTDADKKFTTQFPFTEEGRIQCVDWLNQLYVEKESIWPTRKIDTRYL